VTNPITERWLLLIHQIPPKPTYFRVKIWRRLQQLGAVAIKNSVYVLPKNDQNYESFQWIMKEITQGKGDASICGATFIDGIADSEVEALFTKARNAEYGELAESARKAAKSFPGKAKLTESKRKEVSLELAKFKKRLTEITAIDFFGSSGREVAGGSIDEIESRLRATESGSASIGKSSISASELRGRTWVTRRGIHVDRIASAWLIARFIDPEAKFKYVDGKSYKPAPKELRFDMFEAEFTHEGDLCTFEVLIERTHLNDPALRQIAEIIHNIDLRDEKYRREDTAGIEAVINGICMAHKEDDARLSRGKALFDDLHEYFTRKRK
jgi:hypothetical protein